MDEREVTDAMIDAAIEALGPCVGSCGEASPPQRYDIRDAIEAALAARRTTPDREAVIAAAQRLVRDALDDVRVHPCDEHNDEMRANGLGELMYGLYAALQTAATTPPRDTLIEQIAEMVDHMGEGRRLEEYVGAIREMKTAPTSDKGGA